MSKNRKIILNHFVSLVTLTLFVFPLFVFAQIDRNPGAVDRNPSGGTSMRIEIKNPFKEETIPGLIRAIVNGILMPIGGVLAVAMIMWAGFLFVTARGDPGKITKARDALLYAAIGAAILLGAWVIANAISGTVDQLRSSSN